MFRYLVKFGGTNKLDTIERRSDFEEKCRTIFGIKQECSIRTEIFFEEFGAFAETSDVRSDLAYTGKLRLTVPDEAVELRRIGSDDVAFVSKDNERMR